MPQSPAFKNTLAVIGIPVSCAAIVWLVFLSHLPVHLIPRLVWMIAMICSIGALLWPEEAIVAYVKARWNLDLGLIFIVLPAIVVSCWFGPDFLGVQKVGIILVMAFVLLRQYHWEKARRRKTTPEA